MGEGGGGKGRKSVYMNKGGTKVERRGKDVGNGGKARRMRNEDRGRWRRV